MFNEMWTSLRQWTYPTALRIYPERYESDADAIAALCHELQLLRCQLDGAERRKHDITLEQLEEELVSPFAEATLAEHLEAIQTSLVERRTQLEQEERLLYIQKNGHLGRSDDPARQPQAEGDEQEPYDSTLEDAEPPTLAQVRDRDTQYAQEPQDDYEDAQDDYTAGDPTYDEAVERSTIRQSHAEGGSFPRVVSLGDQQEDPFEDSQEALSATAVRGEQQTFAGDQVPERFAVALSNALFALEHATQPFEQFLKGKQHNTLKEAYALVKQTLGEFGVEYADLAGSPLDPLSGDFEPSEEPAVTDTRPRVIDACSKPRVSLEGRIVQPARGTTSPAS